MLQGILDILRSGEREASNIGRKNFLPATFTGGPRDMRRLTCNPSWPEIKEHLLLNDELQNRPDLVSRVFRAKVEELKKRYIKKTNLWKS